MRTRLFIVQISADESIPTGELLDYVRDAVKCWKGGYHSSDPIFRINRKQITVRYGNSIQRKVRSNRKTKKNVTKD